VSRRGDPGGSVYLEGGVFPAVGHRVPGVQPHPHLWPGGGARPVVVGQGALCSDARGQGCGGVGERDEEGVTLRQELSALTVTECEPHESAMVVEDTAIPLTEKLGEPC